MEILIKAIMYKMSFSLIHTVVNDAIQVVMVLFVVVKIDFAV